MYIMLLERIVERCADPTSNNYGKITKMTAKTVDAYTSDIIPRIGEVIFVDEETAYTVVDVIYNKCCCNLSGENILGVMIEVEPYFAVNIHNTGGYCFEEDWPLIATLENELVNPKN